MNSRCQNLVSKYLLTFWKWWEKDFVLHDLSEEWIKETLIQSQRNFDSITKKLWFNHKETLIQSQRDYVCSSANMIQFYWLSSEFNWEFDKLRHKHDSAICERIAMFRSNDMNVCSSFEHSETSTFVV